METQKRRTTGRVVVETKVRYGIDTVFGIPRTHNLEFCRPLTALGLRGTGRHVDSAAQLKTAADSSAAPSGTAHSDRTAVTDSTASATNFEENQ